MRQKAKVRRQKRFLNGIFNFLKKKEFCRGFRGFTRMEEKRKKSNAIKTLMYLSV